MKNQDLTQEERIEFDSLVIKAMTYGYLVHAHTDYCVFIRFHGHIDELEIDIRKDQNNWQEEVCKTELYSAFKKNYAAGNTFSIVQAKIEVLKSILDTNEIPYSDMDYEVEQIKHHYF